MRYREEVEKRRERERGIDENNIFIKCIVTEYFHSLLMNHISALIYTSVFLFSCFNLVYLIIYSFFFVIFFSSGIILPHTHFVLNSVLHKKWNKWIGISKFGKCSVLTNDILI